MHQKSKINLNSSETIEKIQNKSDKKVLTHLPSIHLSKFVLRKHLNEPKLHLIKASRYIAKLKLNRTEINDRKKVKL